MILRTWRAVAKPTRADDYIEHLREDTLPILRSIPGFAELSLLRRDLTNGSEILVLTRWQSLSAIISFAGEDFTAAVVADKVKGMMIEYDRCVNHYEVVL
ncbi:MAG: antibiotic biosynthesis monooxygenase [Pyrinomonadaceae bacterium]